MTNYNLEVTSISPLSKNTENVKKYKAVYQLSPSFQIQANIIKEYVLKYNKDERVIILNESKQEGKSMYIKDLFSKDDKIVEAILLIVVAPVNVFIAIPTAG